MNRQTDRQRKTDGQTEKDRLKGKHTDGQTDMQTDRERQSNGQTYREKWMDGWRDIVVLAC